MSRADACLVSAGVLLSACGLTLLALDALTGARPWAYAERQGIGFAVGLSSFAFLRYRRARCRDPGVLCALTAPLLLLEPRDGPFALPVDGALAAWLVTWAAVGVVALVLLGRLSRLDGDQWLRLRDVVCVLPPVVFFAFLAFVLDGPAPAFTVAVVASVMIRFVGVRWWQALLPVATLVLLAAILVTALDYRMARLATIVVEAIQRHPPPHAVSLAEMMVRRRDVAVRLGGGQPIWVSLPPRQARQLALARVVAEMGYSGAGLVGLLFGVIGWVGFRSAADEALCVTRLIQAGTTSALVVPAVWHATGCLVLFSAAFGPLPFVSYGPAEQAIAWLALGVMAIAREPRGEVNLPKVMRD